MTTSITLTGADERTDLRLLRLINAEIGLLYTDTPEGRNRYPSWAWIMQAALCLPHCALHVCGRGAREKIARGALPIFNFRRIQINGVLSVSECERICAMYPRHKIITQHRPENQCLLEVFAGNHEVLVDGSGGRGISPDGWNAPATMKNAGYAGGLGPDNLATELPKIAQIAQGSWWVDMEGKLRENDWFSVDLAAQCAEVFYATIPAHSRPQAEAAPVKSAGRAAEGAETKQTAIP